MDIPAYTSDANASRVLLDEMLRGGIKHGLRVKEKDGKPFYISTFYTTQAIRPFTDSIEFSHASLDTAISIAWMLERLKENEA